MKASKNNLTLKQEVIPTCLLCINHSEPERVEKMTKSIKNNKKDQKKAQLLRIRIILIAMAFAEEQCRNLRTIKSYHLDKLFSLRPKELKTIVSMRRILIMLKLNQNQEILEMLSQQKEAVWTKLQAQTKLLSRNDSY